MPDVGHPLFRSLWEKYHFNTSELAKRAGVPEATIVLMLRAQPVYERDAKRILLALSHLVGETYTLKTVKVALIPEDPKN